MSNRDAAMMMTTTSMMKCFLKLRLIYIVHYCFVEDCLLL